VDTFKEYSSEYEFIAEGVFRRIIPPACPQCGKRMCHEKAMVTIWSPKGKAVFICLNITIPGYSISDGGALILEDAVNRSTRQYHLLQNPDLRAGRRAGFQERYTAL